MRVTDARALVGGELLVAETVRPSFRQSWNQSRQVMRLPVQLWKYSCAMIASIETKSLSVAVAGRGQHVFVVEDVEALVLHRAHVEVGHGDDHEDVEIVFAAERLLVPAHGALERIHGVAGAVLLAGLDIDAQRHLAAGRGDEAVLDAAELAADHREQIGGLRPRVVPDREMPAAGQVAALASDCRWRAAPALRLCRPRCGWCRPPSRRAGRGNR